MQTTEPPYDVSLQETHSTVTIKPQLTDAEWAEIQKAGDDILARVNGRKQAPLIVDLSPLEYMGSSMVAMIVRCWKAVKLQNRRFVVVTNNRVVREVLQLSGLAKMWTIVDTREEGLRRLGIRSRVNERWRWRPGGWLLALGAVAVVTAAAGVGLWLARPAQRPLATGLITTGAGVGLGLGIAAAVLTDSRQRLASAAVVVLSLAAGVFCMMQ